MSATKTDLQLKNDIEAELRFDPKVNAAQVGVSVDHGVVTLLGTVDTWAGKSAAEDATKRVAGVRTVALDLAVRLTGEHARTDSDIAAAVQNALRWDVFVPGTVTAEVEEGRVTLRGNATWHFQRTAAERAVRYLTGVISVHNAISLEVQASVTKIAENVGIALQRQASVDAKAIHVVAVGGKVTLSGHATSWQAIADASAAAWASPGVTEVVDHVTLSLNN